MKVIIDIEPQEYKNLGSYSAEKLQEIIEDGTLILNDATNGDVLKAIFPQNGFVLRSGYYTIIGERVDIDYDWWNAKYVGDK